MLIVVVRMILIPIMNQAIVTSEKFVHNSVHRMWNGAAAASNRVNNSVFLFTTWFRGVFRHVNKAKSRKTMDRRVAHAGVR